MLQHRLKSYHEEFPLLLFFLNEKSIYIYGKIGLFILQQHLRFLLCSLHTALSDGRDVRMFSRAIETKCRTHTPFSRTQKYTQIHFPWLEVTRAKKKDLAAGQIFLPSFPDF